MPSSEPESRVPWWRSETAVIRFLAIGGALITLAGVALLVVLAVQNGFLGPVGRVVLAYALATVFAVGTVVVHNRFDKRAADTTTVVNAFLITALLTAMTTTWFVVFHYSWWPSWAGSTLCMVFLAVAFYALRQWRMKTTGIMLGIFGAVFTILWHAKLMYLALGDLDTSMLSWAWPATLPALLLLISTIGRGYQDSRQTAAYLLIASSTTGRFLFSGSVLVSDINFALTALTAVLFIVVVIVDRVPTSAKSEKLAAVWAPVAALFISSLHPSPILGISDHRVPIHQWILLIVLIAVVITGYVITRRTYPDDVLSPAAFVAPALVSVGATAIPLSFFLIDFGSSVSRASGAWSGVLTYDRSVFLALTLVAVVALPRLRAGDAPWITWIGSALVLTSVTSSAVFSRDVEFLLRPERMVEGLFLIIIVTTALLTRASFDEMPPWGRVLIALSGLHLSAVGVVSVTTYIGKMMNQVDLGFFAGHAAVSILWIGLAAYVLLGNNDLSAQTSLSSGTLLAVAGVVKLVFVDLSTIGGMMRVVAFLVSGMALLVIAALRAKRDQSTEKSTEDGALSPAPVPGDHSPESKESAPEPAADARSGE
ncbi:hypothetical protein M0E87_08465 [Corynebacterium sp. CCM 9185]|uniref:DUF2339 domain-containing protein n=1 Tax=Corynebacterium marambiense TaxID=2765364 RepID=A0ABS0VVG8_9CORY|nr:hypothetical protein [Corynebacterium marambiense]MBI9000336.1 hypothetical protein [Corynebacterium marambiense]MCK7663689.1 hypothetical protein [Corynebacterium marambiense]MCX7541876.1 hypothetical protein [Corynebacterium marambiense]